MFELKDFWESNHKINKKHWLTNSNPESVYKIHDISEIVYGEKQLDVLEIGIGGGQSIRELAKKHNLTAIDICNSALIKVNDVAKTFLTENFAEVKDDSIDLAICHLVLQHCNYNMTSFLIKNTIRCLRVNGLFSFQFAYLPDESKLDKFYKNAIKTGTHYFRSIDDVMKIIELNGGKVIKISDPIYHPRECDIEWYMVKCSRCQCNKLKMDEL